MVKEVDLKSIRLACVGSNPADVVFYQVMHFHMRTVEKLQTVVDVFLRSEKMPTDSFGPRFVPEILIPLVSYLFERVKSAGKVKLCS